MLFTLRPASLLCRFIKALQTCICCWCCWLAFSELLILAAARAAAFLNLRLEKRCSLASTNVREKLVPKWTLSEHPAHWNPSGDAPRTVRSHPQSSSSPAEQARVSAWATPAAEMACTNAASRVPLIRQKNKTRRTPINTFDDSLSDSFNCCPQGLMEFFSAFYFVYYKKPLVIRSLLEGKGLLFSYFFNDYLCTSSRGFKRERGVGKKKAR